MKATEQYFSVVLFIMLYEMALTFESVNEILKCDHSNESYRAVLSCGVVYYIVLFSYLQAWTRQRRLVTWSYLRSFPYLVWFKIYSKEKCQQTYWRHLRYNEDVNFFYIPLLSLSWIDSVL